METLCNIANSINWINCKVILQGIVRHRRMLIALLFLALETASFALDQIGGTHFGFLVASFVLSIIGFFTTAYSATQVTTDLEVDRMVIELAFSVVQLIMTYVYLCMSILKVKFKSNIASVFPLVLAVTTLSLAYKHNELVQDRTPTTSERDEEQGFTGTLVHPIHDVVPSDSLSMVGREEEVADSRVLFPPIDASTVVDETPDSRVLHVPTQSTLMVNEEETVFARMCEQEAISTSLISSDTPVMSDDKEIAVLTAIRSEINEDITYSAAAPTTPAIRSRIKMFSKHITTTDLEKEMIVPSEAIKHFQIPEGEDFVDLLVKDMKDDIWRFRLTIKPTPVLREGWLEFVKAKGLVTDEIVTFYKHQNEDFEEQYRVKVDSINNYND